MSQSDPIGSAITTAAKTIFLPAFRLVVYTLLLLSILSRLDAPSFTSLKSSSSIIISLFFASGFIGFVLFSFWERIALFASVILLAWWMRATSV